jgi:hypothetical protein
MLGVIFRASLLVGRGGIGDALALRLYSEFVLIMKLFVVVVVEIYQFVVLMGNDAVRVKLVMAIAWEMLDIGVPAKWGERFRCFHSACSAIRSSDPFRCIKPGLRA